MQQHLLTGRQHLVKPRPVQAVIDVQALAVEADDLCLHPHLAAQLHFVQVVDVRFQGKQRITTLPTAVGIQADALHQRIGGVAEDQQVEGIAQMAVVVDPVRLDRGLVGDQCGHRCTPVSR
ncbi:hypothetical protein D3C84_908180 [compost metagenome]